jgi:hypothetical protein
MTQIITFARPIFQTESSITDNHDYARQNIISKIQIYQYDATVYILAYIVKAFKSEANDGNYIILYPDSEW